MPSTNIVERIRATAPGIPALIILLITLLGSIWWVVMSAKTGMLLLILPGLLVMFLSGFLLFGLFTVHPNEAKVMQLFGAYVGTVRQPGLQWANPFFTAKAVSTRIRNFESGQLKVNDFSGSPIELAAVVVWQVVDTAEAVFCVDDYENFVQIQSEAALRALATRYPYDSQDEEEHSLRGSTQEISMELAKEIQDRLAKAGVEVLEARISHLAYAPEIANAMLQRQQAAAIIAARSKIVEGAVTMVEMALEQLSSKNVVQLDEERKAAMVSNLLVVLCGDRGTQPVVNAGSLHH